MLLEVKNLQVSYGNIEALHGVSFGVDEGEIVTLIGANGAGKSTTLMTISRQIPYVAELGGKVTGGSILYRGEDLLKYAPHQVVSKFGIAQVPEGRKVFKDLTVSENLRMGAYSRNDKAAIDDDMAMVLSLFPRLAERDRQLGGSLSGGEQQMLAIGRGLMARPRLLLLDEPSLGLAPLIIADIFATLRRINQERGTTMLVVEQNAHIALKNASFGYVLQVGRVAVEGVADDLRRNREVVESYMGVQE